jgi:hypothetical protein
MSKKRQSRKNKRAKKISSKGLRSREGLQIRVQKESDV